MSRSLAWNSVLSVADAGIEEALTQINSHDMKLLADNGWTATTWSELLSSDGAEIVARYSSGPLSGSPAVTRRKVGTGEAWYVSAWLEQNSLEQLLSAAVAGLGLQPPAQAPQDVEVVRRVGPTASYLFVLNHGVESATIKVRGVDLLGGALIDGSLTIPAGMVAVVKEL